MIIAIVVIIMIIVIAIVVVIIIIIIVFHISFAGQYLLCLGIPGRCKCNYVCTCGYF